jgi:hypothetical protein
MVEALMLQAGSWRVVVFQFSLSFQLRYGLGVYPASNRNEHQNIFPGGKARQEHKVHNLTAICEPTV